MKQLIDQALRFLHLADRDIRAFHALKNNSSVDLASVGFHAQQAIEKCLKAVLIYSNQDPARTHDLSQLAYAIMAEKITLPLSVEDISKLNPYAVIYRYDDTEVNIVTREEAQEMIETIYSWAKKLVI
ncbi:HEPN domain-containing protein [soil metagenome]